ncbi:2-amino-4-hydroxy-6-hydroxymethyldihydropteridine diphosphokinase [bacterium]|nr:2-amino-4-hydroxy-6-hydroxymethyldihydropteridine diphosphokinase [bacterium]
MNDAIIGAGSNIHADRSIREARKILTETFTLTAESGPLMTEPVGGRPQPFFMNAVYRIRTPLGRTELDRMLKRVESRMGRIRTADRYAPRIMDLDILVWNGKIVHPDVFERKFLRKLLREIGFTVDSRPDLL